MEAPVRARDVRRPVVVDLQYADDCVLLIYMGPGVARAGDSPTSRAPPICFMLLFMDRIPRAIFRFIKNAAACTSYVPKCKVTYEMDGGWMEVILPE